jgi:hypothetical protein
MGRHTINTTYDLVPVDSFVDLFLLIMFSVHIFCLCTTVFKIKGKSLKLVKRRRFL